MFTISQIAKVINGNIDGDPNLKIQGVCDKKDGKPNFVSYITSEKSIKMEIEDINSLENLESKDEIVFKSDDKYYYGVDGIIKSMEASNKSPIFIKILIYTPKVITKKIYKFISNNRYRISKLFSVIKPKP